MRVAGIDVSTFAIDIVTVPLDTGWDVMSHRPFLLYGHDAFDRTRMIGEVMPGRTSEFWDDILAVVIEEPAGKQRHVTTRVQGAVLSMIPARMLVEVKRPNEWRHLVGLSGGASKEEVRVWAEARTGPLPSQDAADAYCMARACRVLMDREEARRAAAG